MPKGRHSSTAPLEEQNDVDSNSVDSAVREKANTATRRVSGAGPDLSAQDEPADSAENVSQREAQSSALPLRRSRRSLAASRSSDISHLAKCAGGAAADANGSAEAGDRPNPVEEMADSTLSGLNGQAGDTVKQESDSENPSKRRKTTRSARSRRPSPPWNPRIAGGPSYTLVEGRRRSSRLNGILNSTKNSATPETRPEKRAEAPAEIKAEPLPPEPKPRPSRSKPIVLPSADSVPVAPEITPQSRRRGREDATPTSEPSAPTTPASRSPKDTLSIRTTIKRSTNTQSKSSPPCKNGTPTTARASAPRRSTRLSAAATAAVAEADTTPSKPPPAKPKHEPRIIKIPAVAVANSMQNKDTSSIVIKKPRLQLKLPLPEPKFLRPGSRPAPKKYSSFTEWLENDDPLQGEDDARFRRAKLEKRVSDILRLQDVLGESGILGNRDDVFSSISSGKTLEPPSVEDPARYYGNVNRHWDNVIAHSICMRRLMRREGRTHTTEAKKVAHAVAHEVATNPKWSSRRIPVDQDEAEQKEIKYQKHRYRQLVKDIGKMWDLVREENRKIKLKEWEKEQQEESKRALDSMLDRAKVLVERRQNKPLVSRTGVEVDDDDEEFETDDEEDDSMSDISDFDSTSMISMEVESRPASSAADNSSVVLPLKQPSVEASSRQDSPDLDSVSDDSSVEFGTDTDEDAQSVDLTQLARPSSLPAQTEDIDSVRDSSPLTPINKITTNMHSCESEAEDGTSSESEEGEPSTMWELYSKYVPGIASASKSDKIKTKTENRAMLQIETNNASKLPTENKTQDPVESETTPGFDISPVSEAPSEAKTVMADGDSPLATYEVEKDASARSQNKTPNRGNSLSHTPQEQDKLVEVPSTLLRGTLREYQHHGLDWLSGLYAQRTNGILADEMGLGKTIQTISLLAHLAVHHQIWGPHLIVVPTSVMLNWEMEFKKWCPGFKILTYYGTREERKKKRQGWMKDDVWNVVITSYQLILQDALAFKKKSWHYLVLDEAHNIKNFQTQRWQTLLNFRTHSRLLLTGTPLQNNLSELWSLLFFLMPGGLDTEGGFAGLDQFITAMKKPADQILEQERKILDAEAQQAVRKLHEVLRPYILRRLKADVERQIPAKYEHVILCKLSKRQRQLYDEFLGRDATKQALSSGNYMNIINCLMNLRKVCNHPDLFETRPVVTSLVLKRCVFSTLSTVYETYRRELTRSRDSLSNINLEGLGLRFVDREKYSASDLIEGPSLQACRKLKLIASRCAKKFQELNESDDEDCSTFEAEIIRIRHRRQEGVLQQLCTAARIAQSRRHFAPVYGKRLVEQLNFGFQTRPFVRAPVSRPCIDILQDCPLSSVDSSPSLSQLSLSVSERSTVVRPLVRRFAVVTPAIVVPELNAQVIPSQLVSVAMDSEVAKLNGPFHDAQVKLSISFPEKFLLQYDCGKLQTLDKLLRRLQSGGHRALIFTQMTKVLDILEAFLNMHGHRYLRLDGSTKVEQRQLLTDQFNNDPRILCFILSSRSGGLGINLTGADTVIFYDLDWNPAMDKQCQDRCHRIGQTRDVHIYRLVSEHTIETNILKKSNQKRLLDDVIIQKGDFTTDYFNRVTYRDAMDGLTDGVLEENAGTDVLEKVLDDVAGGRSSKVVAAAEDQEDASAAKAAQREMQQADLVDFDEVNSVTGSSAATPGPADEGASVVGAGVGGPEGALDGKGTEMAHVDEYMLRLMTDELRDVAVLPPGWKERKKKLKGGRGRPRR